MKIACILEEGRWGGPQVQAIQIAQALRQENIVIDIIAPKKNSDKFKKLSRDAGVKMITVPLSKISKQWDEMFRYIAFSFNEIIKLKNIIKENNYDIVCSFGGAWQYKGVIAGKWANKKIIWRINDSYMPFFIRILFSRLSGLSNGFIFNSERSRAYYRKYMNRVMNEQVIQSCVDVNEFDPLENYSFHNSNSRHDMNERNSNEKIIIGTVANISRVKGLEIFLRAAHELNKYHSNIQFIVVGSIFKGQKKYYKKLIKMRDQLSLHNFNFEGGGLNVRETLSNMNIYVCSSHSESSPVSVWEAMSMARPIVSTDAGDVSVLVRDNYCGFVVPAGDWLQLSNRLSLLITDKGLCDKFGARAREIATKQLSVEQCVKKYKDYFGNVKLAH